MKETGSNHSIYHNILIKTSVDKVFEAVSDPKHLINWWPSICTGKPMVGEEYNLFFTEEYNWYGIVNEYDFNRKFVIKMTRTSENWDSTSFGFEVEEMNENVLLRFFHSGWKEQNDHFRITSFCWAMLLNGLKNYLEKGTIIPFEERS